MGQAIQFNKRDLGAPDEWITIVLAKDADDGGYSERRETGELTAGQWRWVFEGREKWLEIFFKANQFPCTMVGVFAKDEGTVRQTGVVVDTDRVVFMAHGHNYERDGCEILEAAKYLREHDRGAWNALVFDEGQDVFQLAKLQVGQQLNETVEMRRNQLRCVFWANERADS